MRGRILVRVVYTIRFNPPPSPSTSPSLSLPSHSFACESLFKKNAQGTEGNGVWIGLDWIGMGSGEIAPVRTSLFPFVGRGGLWVGQSVSEHRSVTFAPSLPFPPSHLLLPNLRKRRTENWTNWSETRSSVVYRDASEADICDECGLGLYILSGSGWFRDSRCVIGKCGKGSPGCRYCVASYSLCVTPPVTLRGFGKIDQAVSITTTT